MRRAKWLYLSILLVFLTILLLSGCGHPDDSESASKEIIVSAASSLQEVMDEIKDVYTVEGQNVKIIMNYGSSGTLQNQIEQGAPVDIFISAGVRQMDYLEEKKLLLDGARVDLLSNELVLITPKENRLISGLDDLRKPEVKQIAIGTPETVPAGIYAKEALVSLGYWDSLTSKLVFAKDVKQVLAYVETGNVEAGLVYLSDSKASDKVEVVAAIPEKALQPIRYPASVIEDTKEKETAEDFLKYLQGSQAEEIFTKHGFKIPDKI